MKRSTANFELSEIPHYESDSITFTHKLSVFSSASGHDHSVGQVISEIALSDKDLIELNFIFGNLQRNDYRQTNFGV